MRAFLAAIAVAGLWPLAAHADAVVDADNGVMAARSGEYSQAIDLFTRAIDSNELTDSGRAQAFAYRGIAKATTSDYAGAREDLSLSVALDSDYNADAYAYRGLVALVTGNAKAAATDLEKSAHLNRWSYNILWLHLARARAGVPDTDDVSLSGNIAAMDAMREKGTVPTLERWPGPVMKVYLGQAKPETALAAAKEGDAARLGERTCDADFYIAEYHLTHKDAKAAKGLLESAAETCPLGAFERMGAVAELAQLK